MSVLTDYIAEQQFQAARLADLISALITILENASENVNGQYAVAFATHEIAKKLAENLDAVSLPEEFGE